MDYWSTFLFGMNFKVDFNGKVQLGEILAVGAPSIIVARPGQQTLKTMEKLWKITIFNG